MERTPRSTSWRRRARRRARRRRFEFGFVLLYSDMQLAIVRLLHSGVLGKEDLHGLGDRKPRPNRFSAPLR